MKAIRRFTTAPGADPDWITVAELEGLFPGLLAPLRVPSLYSQRAGTRRVTEASAGIAPSGGSMAQASTPAPHAPAPFGGPPPLVIAPERAA